MDLKLKSIGTALGGRVVPEDDDWGRSRCRLILDAKQFEPDALAGLGDFSHIEVVFVFNRVTDDNIVSGARHPRGNKDWPKVGIFAQRGKNRPNRIGVSVCRLVAVVGLSIEVEGLDVIDGTPILDIKPVMKGFQPRGVIIEPAWATQIMKDYW
ncbi:MAG: SAM-dependent methyltransferase [Hyphomicrobiaceae bacterium]